MYSISTVQNAAVRCTVYREQGGVHRGREEVRDDCEHSKTGETECWPEDWDPVGQCIPG